MTKFLNPITSPNGRQPAIFLCLLLLLASAPGLATVPQVIPVGGMLADSDGQPLDGAFAMTFSLYDAETGGTALWSESRTGSNAVQIEDGMFTAYLGDVAGNLNFSTLVAAGGLWLGIAVNTDAEMNRIFLGTVPFAMEAAQCRSIVDPLAEGLATQDWVTQQGYSKTSQLTAYATQTWVSQQGYLTVDANTNAETECTGAGVFLDGEGNCVSIDLTGYASQAWVNTELTEFQRAIQGTTCAYGISDIDTLGNISCAGNPITAHENAYGHLSTSQLADLTDGGETSLHSHAAENQLPQGVIVMWSGTLATIPAGWALCDGSNGTPDLTDRFIMGVLNTEDPGDTGGENSLLLDESQLPSHSHTAQADTNAGHVHTGSTSSDGNHSHSVRKTNTSCSSGSTYVSFVQNDQGDYSGAIVSNGAHSHTLSVANGGSHTHAITVDSTGSGAVIDNRPAYFRLAFIMKL